MAGWLTVEQLQIGDSLLYEKQSGVSKTIQVGTRARVGHASLVTGVNTVHEALPEGYKARNILKSYEDSVNIYVKRPMFIFNSEILVNWCIQHEGTKYDFKGTGLQQSIRQLTGKWLWQNDDSKLYCSEANLRAYFAATLGKVFSNPQKSPGDILYDFINFETYELKFRL